MTSIVTAVPLSWVLIVAGTLFCIGLFGALTRRNIVGMLLGIELMLNAVNINLVKLFGNDLVCTLILDGDGSGE